MIATIAERFFPAFAAIIAIIWKPTLRVLSEIYFACKGLKKSRVKFCLKHFLFVVLYESRALTEIHTSMFELWQPLEVFSAFSFERNFHFFRVSLTICIAKRN